MRQSEGMGGGHVVNVEEAGAGDSRAGSKFEAGVARTVGHVPGSVDKDVFGGGVVGRVGRVGFDGAGYGYQVGVMGRGGAEHVGEEALSSVQVPSCGGGRTQRSASFDVGGEEEGARGKGGGGAMSAGEVHHRCRPARRVDTLGQAPSKPYGTIPQCTNDKVWYVPYRSKTSSKV